MVKTATFATRFISFVDAPHAPAELRLSEDQEVVAEDPPSLVNSGLQRFVYVRGPLCQPVHVLRRERLPDGSAISVRYEPDLDVICANVTRG